MYNIDKLLVQTPFETLGTYVTARQDDRSEQELVRAINRDEYFGPGYHFVKKLTLATDIPSKEQADRVAGILLAAFEEAGEEILNKRTKPAEIAGRPVIPNFV